MFGLVRRQLDTFSRQTASVLLRNDDDIPLLPLLVGVDWQVSIEDAAERASCPHKASERAGKCQNTFDNGFCSTAGGSRVAQRGLSYYFSPFYYSFPSLQGPSVISEPEPVSILDFLFQ